tara:strand:- start:9186 stop:9635 length:450 start_codon:yes stop_codon:yes gene_type:complete
MAITGASRCSVPAANHPIAPGRHHRRYRIFSGKTLGGAGDRSHIEDDSIDKNRRRDFLMKRTLLIALVGAVLLPAIASADSDRVGRRLDAIQSGRLYDRIMTPQMNPNFEFQPNAEAMFLRELRQGRVNVDKVPEAQLRYFQMQLDNSR